MKTHLLTLFTVALFSSINGQSTFKKLTAQDRVIDETLGWSVSISGDYAVSGAPHFSIFSRTDTIKDAGAVYIFKRNRSGEWIQNQRLINPAPKDYDWFGTDVQLAGDYLAIGMNGYDTNETDADSYSRNGAVLIYKKNEEGIFRFSQFIKLHSGIAKDDFGKKVALSPPYLLISAPHYKRTDKGYPENSSGITFLYRLDSSGKWDLQDSIIPHKPVGLFGSEIALFKDHILIANNNSVEVDLYRIDPNSGVDHSYSFKAPCPKRNNFGSDISISKDFVFIGASGEGDYEFFDVEQPATDSVIILNIFNETDFTLRSKIIPNIKESLDSFNISNERFKREAIVYESWAEREKRKAGAGTVYVYKRNENDHWELYQTLTARDAGADDHFGMCLSSSETTLVIGAFGDKLDKGAPKDGMYHGAAYVFNLDEEGYWAETIKLRSEQDKMWLKFGFSVDADEDRAIIGSRFEYISEKNNGGAVYLYESKPGTNGQ